MEKVVFLDRDGTINIEKNYLYRIEDFQFIYGAPEAIHLLNKNNFKVVVVTNQAGVARGYYSENDIRKLHDFINFELIKFDAHIDNFFYCPHHPVYGIGEYKVKCNCRKPGIGMLCRIENIFEVDKEHSWIIGDSKNDILAGKNYNIKSVLVATGYGSKFYEQEKRSIPYNYFAKDILEAVKYILNSDTKCEGCKK